MAWESVSMGGPLVAAGGRRKTTGHGNLAAGRRHGVENGTSAAGCRTSTVLMSQAYYKQGGTIVRDLAFVLQFILL
jgi:hypothetical protein